MSQFSEIETLVPSKKEFNSSESIVTADLEAIIKQPEGINVVYMAAWYNGETYRIFDISQWGYNTTTMLEQFWIDLLKNNKGRICYFHNFGGYDAILSMPSLLNIPNLAFYPIMKDGEIISIKVAQKGKVVLTIKDSIKILPGALSKLAKDWGVETQKDHFPHYFWNGSIKDTLNYEGFLPPYSKFEPKRTSLIDYEEMVKEFKNKTWSFLRVSEFYILGDVKATYQVLVKYFETLITKFPIDPLKIYSAPSAAFRIWRTLQLPLLHQEGLKVYDLSHNIDSLLRESYCGGIVDVYRPHLIGKGYYYDVNSLYPTAMCKSMPVGMPQLVEFLTKEEFLKGEFFGFLEATVRAPANEYIGLLPIKLQGRLICPGGTFSGLFFSEELKFALENGYQLLEIKLAYSFKRGANTFLQLITQLNSMKIEAQRNSQPTIRNLAKLLMNSMYGRFGMHPTLTAHGIYTSKQMNQITPAWIVQNAINFGELSLVTLLLNKNWILENQGVEGLIKHLTNLGNNTNVAIAAAVTAYSRMIINQYKLDALKLGLNLFYSDTDSLILDGPLPENYIHSATLGKLKLEHIFKEGIFVMPKVYYLEKEDGSIVSKVKGFPGKLSKAQYLELLEGRSIDLEITKWSKSLKESFVKIETRRPYTLSFTFNKRQQIKNSQGIWTNTTPIKIKT
ncbi:DNA polymerase B [Rhizophagus irregularis DAOM 181602=DAOM 197198]|uniref:DNA polymerase n=2 Tax=Rhizophagus irregularis (strain DAOM 181602 / DAOM 197198 / MUCL 43194) TaxID=747089 RepID=A0A2P4NLF4_RHIID|nr:DNA polymerase B [Rhizophagus irregularis DAOM 181602=DAOM 197198]POG53951.1 DNA polymerase B [Rhizophagus irregularis DAOM 181602=DAOM 197198]|eukprot:XP_025164191.1 DNA polymerase B [Rhizophagus irregularis DAOM 181602=DAOM 197198]